ncbi:sigma-70 family RNA polymerase sigma factor [Cellulomonas sp. S1-8]|nr:sigma-70 family RNA polymerase sigma factor [Cellulomonas sp. S1-8]
MSSVRYNVRPTSFVKGRGQRDSDARRTGEDVRDTARDIALTGLVRDRGAELTRYAYAFTGELTAAQDLLQEALVKVFVRTRAGLDAEVLEAYVRRAIATTYIDGYRRARTFEAKRHLSARPDSTAGPEVHAPERLDLHAALATLGRQERAAVVLRYLTTSPSPRSRRSCTWPKAR